MRAIPALLLLALAGCARFDTASAIVALTDQPRPLPRHVILSGGETVEWRNGGHFPRRLTFTAQPPEAAAIPAVTVPPGAWARLRFHQPGLYRYEVGDGPDAEAGEIEVRGGLWW